MAAYAKFAKFYDQVMGDRSPLIERVRGYVERYLPAAESLLELGCGTGAVLAGLAPGLRVTGVDRSPEMLATAARNAATASLVEADITAFSLGARFDVVICVFDTLNHLPTFDSWLQAFGQVDAHLAEGGLFVFDVNTVGRLRRLSRAARLCRRLRPAHAGHGRDAGRRQSVAVGRADLRACRGRSVPAAP